MMSTVGSVRLVHPRVCSRSEPVRLFSALAGARSAPRPAYLRVTVRPYSPVLASQSSVVLINGISGRSVGNIHQPSSLQKRYFSSKKQDFQLDALPYTISAEQALERFKLWADEEQGLNYLLRWESVRIGASYVPVWSFDINVRFITTTEEGKRVYDWKPEIFAEAYGNQPVMYVPGLSTYAGYTYRRSLVNPIVNTTLVFMGDKTMPFEKYMLRDMKLSNGERIKIFPDPWNATRGRCFDVIKEELDVLAQEAPGNVKVQTEILGARRVYIPVYVIDYKILGAQYQAFASGCDAGAGVSGVSHRVLGSSQEMQKASHSFLTNAANFGARLFGGRGGSTRLIVLLQLLGSLGARILSRLPLIGAVGGIFVGFRKIVQPWMDNRLASARWERQREHEAMDSEHDPSDDFVDNGSAKRYFDQNRTRIIHILSGAYAHEQGEYDWYKEWEEWARRQFEQQQQQQQEAYRRQQEAYGRERRAYEPPKQKAKPKYEWDFNPDDPYSVLGIRRGATKDEVSKAFRREMLKHHPDTQANASDAAKERATERSKIITDAYRKIKAEMK